MATRPLTAEAKIAVFFGTVSVIIAIFAAVPAWAEWQEFRRWWASLRPEVSPTPAPPELPPDPRPSPTPSPQGTPSPEAERVITFRLASEDNPGYRETYCAEGTFTAEARVGVDSIDVLITEARLDLCAYSAFGRRRVSFRVGVGSYDGIAGAGDPARGRRLVAWSESVSRILCPGEVTLIESVRLRVPRGDTRGLSGNGIIIQLTNEPVGTTREVSYCLYTAPDIFDGLAYAGQ